MHLNWPVLTVVCLVYGMSFEIACIVTFFYGTHTHWKLLVLQPNV